MHGGVGFRDIPTDGSVFDWFKRGKKQQDPLASWRATWTEAVERDTGITAGQLRAQLEQYHGGELDLEVEFEMIDALEALRTLQEGINSGLPIVETRHRVVGPDACHFSAPASVPGEGSQTPGRVLFTAARAIFVGGGGTSGAPWHAVHEALRSERDLLLVRSDGTPAAHYRFNTFGDAVRATFLARHLRKARVSRL